MATRSSCKNCGSFDLEIDPCRGDTVCTICGIVLEDSVIVSEVQFEENAHGGSTAIGQFVPNDSKGGNMTIIGSFTYGLQKESKEITIQKAKSELSRMCQLLRINQHCLETALTFYKMALNRHLTKGRRSSLVCAACLYIACRLEKTPHLLIDFSDVLQVDPFTLGRTFTSITQDLYITLPLVDPCIYILRYANQMNLGDKTHEVCTTALRVLKRMKRDFLHCGRRPSGLCGSALIIAARFHKIPKKLKDIVNIVHIQEVTLRKRLMEFGDTPSSSLTTDEFLTVDLGEEQDPPSFKIARLKDKERLQKYTDVEYEMKMKKLQRIIERELEKKKNRGKRSYSACSFDDESVASTETTESSRSLLKDIIGDNLDDDNEINNAVAESTIESITEECISLKNDQNTKYITSSPKELGPTLETIGMNLEINKNTDDEETNELENVVINKDSNTSEIVDVSMDDLDEEELDSYIVTEEEFKQKQKAWSELYATYLEEQKTKEEEKLNKEREDGKPDKKKKRQKKNKGNGAATAGEAVEQVLREKKISNKLNYDVLKSLNMDDFVKSIDFDSTDEENNKNKSQKTSNLFKMTNVEKDKRSSQTSINTIKRVTEEAENDEDYDETDYDDEEDEEENSILKLSGLVRRDYNEEEDYEEYD